ncbi:MAG: CPBP family intramembrane metalloprotease [Synergistaceae bacterium]|jgi:membrane protease YdiL (CAAX protease family)|nr:CPBP family intramembrane metalloprotease [Synergistaceae bacterium]
MLNILKSYVFPTVAGLAFMGIPFFWCRIRREDPESYGLSWKFEAGNVYECLMLTATILLPLTVISVLWPLEALPRHSAFWRSLNLAAAGISAAIIEEIFFRGWLLPLFRKRFNAFWAIVFTSVLFAISHIFVAQTPFLFAVFFPGCVMGFLRERHGNISTSTLFHALGNLWAIWFAPLRWPTMAWLIQHLPILG